MSRHPIEVHHHRRSGVRLLATAFVLVAVVLVGRPSDAAAGDMSIGPQAMEGDLKINPGDTVRAGVSFTIPGSHPATAVQFVGAAVSFANVTCASGSGGGSFTIPLGSGDVLGPYNVPADNSAWFPTGDQSNAAAYQGSLAAPDLCSGGTMTLRNGGTCTASLQASDTAHSANVRFHYSSGGSSGSWSATKSFTPAPLASDPVPTGVVGVFAVAILLGIVLLVAQRRRPQLVGSSVR